MNKEEILAKSRDENKSKDVYEQEVLKEAGNAGAITAAIVCAIFFVVQLLVGEGLNYGLWSVIFSMEAACFIVKAVRMKRTHEILIAILYTITALLTAAGHIYNLLITSDIL